MSLISHPARKYPPIPGVCYLTRVRLCIELELIGIVYDDPVLRIPSRSSLLTHLLLLHLISSGSIPAPTPSNVLRYTKLALHRGVQSVLAITSPFGVSGRKGGDEESGSGVGAGYRDLDLKGKGRDISASEKKGNSKGKGKASKPEKMELGNFKAEEVSGGGARKGKDKWKLWEVGAECLEIGGMECYDGHHLGMIEQYVPSLHPLFFHHSYSDYCIPGDTALPQRGA